MSEHQVAEQFKAAKWVAQKLYPEKSSHSREKRNDAIKTGAALLCATEVWLDDRYKDLSRFYIESTIKDKPKIAREKQQPSVIIRGRNIL